MSNIFKKKSKLKILIDFAKSEEMQSTNHIFLILFGGLVISCLLSLTVALWGMLILFITISVNYYIAITDKYDYSTQVKKEIQRIRRVYRIRRGGY